MAATYLELTNELLRELNEVTLTSSSFSGALGIQAHVKDCVNRAYLDIVNEEAQWPFLAVSASGTLDPMYGNVSVDTELGVRWYLLKQDSTDGTTDYSFIDWDNFYITTAGVTGETAPYSGRNLRFISIEEWKDYLRTQENLDDANTQQYGQPRFVIRSPDNRKFGLSPIPDKVYKVWFYAYKLPVELIYDTDTILFQNIYKPVLLARARYYLHQFKEESQAAAFAMEDYRRGLQKMRHNLMSPAPTYFKDDRMRFI